MNALQRLELWAAEQRPSTLMGIAGASIGVLAAVIQTAPASAEGVADQAIFWNLLLLVAAVVLQELLRPKQNIESARPKGLGDFQFPTATEDRVVPVIFGRVMVSGPNVVWYGDLAQEAISETVKTGLWSKERFIKGFKYRLGVQFGLCVGGGDGVAIRRVQVDDIDVFSGNVSTETFFDIDAEDVFGGDDYGNGGLQATCDFFPGSLTQGVSAYLDTADRQRVTTAATPSAPRYLGVCYLVMRELTGATADGSESGAYLGNSTNVQPMKFELERYPSIFSGQSAGENKVGSSDCNPINVFYEMLTDRDWGRGYDPTKIDLASFVDAADTLRTEGNGFSMTIDSPKKMRDLKTEIERQINGVLYQDRTTGLWKVRLIRDDYTLSAVPKLTDDNVIAVRDYYRASWEDTTNQVTVRFDKRADEYKGSFAMANDMANAIILGDGSVTQPRRQVAPIVMPGVKDSTLAANLAWRELRSLSFPLAKATIIVNREFWDANIGDVFAWTWGRLGFVDLPIRVLEVDFGDSNSKQIALSVVQDVFSYAAASTAAPGSSSWTEPTVGLVAYPSAQQRAFEAPRALVVRDPEYAGSPDVSKIFAAVRRQGGEVGFRVTQRNASGTPSGAYADAGDIVGFVKIGELAADLDAGTAMPTSTIAIDPDPDSQTAIEALFDDTTTTQDLGVDLVQLVMVGEEFMLVQSAADSGPNVNLQNVWRGALDSGQNTHAAGTPVYMLFAGAGIADPVITNTNNVDVQLRARSAIEVFSGSVTTIAFQMAKRTLRPYPPATFLYNGSGTVFGTPSLEGDGSGLNGVGFDVDLRRRRFDTANEVLEMLNDNAVDASTEHRVRIYVDPDGANTLAYDSGWFSGASVTTRPTQAELVAVAAAGTKIKVVGTSRHDYAGETAIESRNQMEHDVTPTSARSAQFYLGGSLGPSTASNAYTVATAGVHTINIGASYATSNVQVRINGGTWTTVISAGGTTGNTAALSISDTLEVRHTASETPDPNFIEVNDGTSDVAYGTFSA